MNPSEIDSLKEFVHEEICERNQLLPNVFPFTLRVVKKAGRACGLFFCLHGPRAIRLTAVYDVDENVIHFYDSNGKRTDCSAWDECQGNGYAGC